MPQHNANRLFDPGGLEPVGHGIYFAMPMTGTREAQETSNKRFLNQAHAALAQAEKTAMDAGLPWKLKPLTGQQHSTPWGRSADPDGARRWIRNRFVREVDGLAIVLQRESTGCGKELALALALGIPTAVFRLYEPDPGIHVGRTVFEGALSTHPFRAGELTTKIADWLIDHRLDIQAQPNRRATWIDASNPLRRRLLNAWEQLEVSQRDTVAAHVYMQREQLSAILTEPGEFAARAGAILKLGEILGVIAALDEHDAPVGQFTSHEVDHLEDAIATYDWSPSDVAAAVRAASDLRAKTGAMKGRLSSKRAWRRMLTQSTRLADVRDSRSAR